MKKGEGYIVYYVNSNGTPGAVDTEGNVYTAEEAMKYLKEYDMKKYAKSESRARELGLYGKFAGNEVLI